MCPIPCRDNDRELGLTFPRSASANLFITLIMCGRPWVGADWERLTKGEKRGTAAGHTTSEY